MPPFSSFIFRQSRKFRAGILLTLVQCALGAGPVPSLLAQTTPPPQPAVRGKTPGSPAFHQSKLAVQPSQLQPRPGQALVAGSAPARPIVRAANHQETLPTPP